MKKLILVFLLLLLLFSCKSADSKDTIIPFESESNEISEKEIFSDNLEIFEFSASPESPEVASVKENPADLINEKNADVFEPEIFSFTDDLFLLENTSPSEPENDNMSEEFSDNDLYFENSSRSLSFTDEQNENELSVLEPLMQNDPERKESKTSVSSNAQVNKSQKATNKKQTDVTPKTKQSSSVLLSPEPEVTIAFNTPNNTSEEKTEYNDAVKCHNLAGNEFKKKNYKRSLELTDYYLIHFTDYLDEMLFLKGQILEILSVDGTGDIGQAKDCYEKLVSLYPQSKWYLKAQDRIKYIDRFYFNVW